MITFVVVVVVVICFSLFAGSDPRGPVVPNGCAPRGLDWESASKPGRQSRGGVVCVRTHHQDS